MNLKPNRGQIWLANLNPVMGHEQAGRRPVLIMSLDIFNHGPAGLIFAIPLTRTDRAIPWHVAIDPPEGGLKHKSFVLCEKMRSISKARLVGKTWGMVTQETLEQIEDKLKGLLLI